MNTETQLNNLASQMNEPFLVEDTVITTICMFCKAFINTKPGLGVTGTSHGICLPCQTAKVWSK